MYSVPLMSNASAAAVAVGCVKQDTTACPRSALLIHSGNKVLRCVEGLPNCLAVSDASAGEAFSVTDQGSLVGCGFGFCPDAYPVTSRAGEDLRWMMSV
jgi:hypothetical protein